MWEIPNITKKRHYGNKTVTLQRYIPPCRDIILKSIFVGESDCGKSKKHHKHPEYVAQNRRFAFSNRGYANQSRFKFSLYLRTD